MAEQDINVTRITEDCGGEVSFLYGYAPKSDKAAITAAKFLGTLYPDVVKKRSFILIHGKEIADDGFYQVDEEGTLKQLVPSG